MSLDKSTIPFPADKFRAETLRSMAMDLGIMAGGKKTELLQRLRESSASGWTTPPKRKKDAEASETPSASVKKPRTPRTVPKTSATLVTPSSPTTRRRSRRRRASDAVVVEPLNEEHPSKDATSDEDARSEKNPRNDVDLDSGAITTTLDEYLISDTTNMFITGRDLLAMINEVPATEALVLWKGSTHLADHGRAPSERAHHWLIPCHEGDDVQNVAAFKEEHKGVLQNERLLEGSTNGKDGASDDVDNDDGAKSSTRWYEISVSRSMGKGALAVKLIKGTVQGKEIVPIKDIKGEGVFWLSTPIPASQKDSESLDHLVQLLL